MVIQFAWDAVPRKLVSGRIKQDRADSVAAFVSMVLRCDAMGCSCDDHMVISCL